MTLMKKTKNYKNQILDSIKINYFEMIKEYDEKSKSDFWKKKFNKAKLEKFNLKYFRKKNIWGYSLNQGMEDDKNFYDTMISLIRVLNETNISDIKNLIELEVGKPKYYNFGDIKANYHEFFTIKQLNRISKYLKNDHKSDKIDTNY